MKGLKRKICSVVPCQESPFFRPALKWESGDTAFFRPGSAVRSAGPDSPVVQRQENKEEEKNPVTEGVKTTAEKLAEHKPFKDWYEPKLEQLKLSLWENARPEDKVALLTFLGLNLGTAATAFALSPELRKTLSDVNIGKPLGWIPYSPVEGFKYKLPELGKSTYGFSADFTFNPYLEALRKKAPGMPLTGATFGLESAYDPSSKGFSLTGGKFGLEFLGGGLKAEGKTFTELSPYPMWMPGNQPGEPGSWLMQSVPGLPPMKTGPGFQFMVNADLLKLFPALKPIF